VDAGSGKDYDWRRAGQWLPAWPGSLLAVASGVTKSFVKRITTSLQAATPG